MNRLINFLDKYFILVLFAGLLVFIIGAQITWYEALKNNPPVILGNKKLICEPEEIK